MKSLFFIALMMILSVIVIKKIIKTSLYFLLITHSKIIEIDSYATIDASSDSKINHIIVHVDSETFLIKMLLNMFIWYRL